MVHGEWGYENMHAQKKTCWCIFSPAMGPHSVRTRKLGTRIWREKEGLKSQKPELPRQCKWGPKPYFNLELVSVFIVQLCWQTQFLCPQHTSAQWLLNLLWIYTLYWRCVGELPKVKLVHLEHPLVEEWAILKSATHHKYLLSILIQSPTPTFN